MIYRIPELTIRKTYDEQDSKILKHKDTRFHFRCRSIQQGKIGVRPKVAQATGWFDDQLCNELMKFRRSVTVSDECYVDQNLSM